MEWNPVWKYISYLKYAPMILKEIFSKSSRHKDESVNYKNEWVSDGQHEKTVDGCRFRSFFAHDGDGYTIPNQPSHNQKPTDAWA